MTQLTPSKRKWCVLVGAVVCQFVASWPFSLGVVYHELIVLYDERKDFTALVVSVSMGVSFMAGIFVGPLSSRFGPRAIVTTGSVIMTAAFVISFFATNITYLIVSIGFVGGLGSCMVNVGSYLALAQHFDSGIDIAFSAAALGSSLSGLSLFLFHDFLISQYGLHGCLLITGAVFLHALPAGAVMEQRNIMRHSRGDNPSKINMKQKYIQLFANPLFVTWLIIGLIGTLTTSCYFIIFVDYVVEMGVPETSAALMMTVSGASGIPGRLLFGYLSNKVPHRKLLLSTCSLAVNGVLIVSLAFIKSELVFFIVSALNGACVASVVVSFSIVTEHLSKPEHRSEAFGFASTAYGIGLLISGPLAGHIYEITHSFSWSFLWNGVLNLSACLLVVFFTLLVHIRRRGNIVVMK